MGDNPPMDGSFHQRITRRIPGVVAATLIDGDTEYGGFGTLDHVPNPGALRWEIGSITKVFTGILLTEMSLRGEVALDDPIGLHVPDEVAARMPGLELQPTLSDLSSHTAGLPRIPRQWLKRLKGTDDPYSRLSEQDVWDVLGPATLRPRKRRSRYSNYGAGLLGHLLGRAAGIGYETLVSDRILTPLGLSATGFGSTDVVQGYRGRRPTPPWTFGALQGAGALRSTAADMIAFAGACIEGPDGILGEAMELARQPVYSGRFGLGSVGLGWQMRALPPGRPAGRTTWHNGGTYGGSSFLAVDPERRTAVAAFGNRGPRITSPLDGPSWKLFDGLGTGTTPDQV